MACKPKIVPTAIVAPTKEIECFNCGCTVPPGDCHCGAKNWWAFDPFDGWYASGRVSSSIRQQKTP